MRRPKRSGAQYSLSSRYWVAVGVILLMFGYLVSGIFQLQILEGEDYSDTAENKTTAEVVLEKDGVTPIFENFVP